MIYITLLPWLCILNLQGEEEAHSFVRDFILTQLHGEDLDTIYHIEHPMTKLSLILSGQGRGEPEPRLLGQQGHSTVVSCYTVGIYCDKKLIGKCKLSSTIQGLPQLWIIVNQNYCFLCVEIESVNITCSLTCLLDKSLKSCNWNERNVISEASNVLSVITLYLGRQLLYFCEWQYYNDDFHRILLAPGETPEIAEQMAAQDALLTIYGIQDNRKPLDFTQTYKQKSIEQQTTQQQIAGSWS